MMAKNKAVLVSFGGFNCKLRPSVCGAHLNFYTMFPGSFWFIKSGRFASGPIPDFSSHLKRDSLVRHQWGNCPAKDKWANQVRPVESPEGLTEWNSTRLAFKNVGFQEFFFLYSNNRYELCFIYFSAFISSLKYLLSIFSIFPLNFHFKNFEIRGLLLSR